MRQAAELSSVAPGVRRLPGLLAHHAVENLFAYFVPLACSAVDPSEPEAWLTVAPNPPGPSPVHLELMHGKGPERARYNARHLEACVQRGSVQLGSHRGLWDLFVPLQRGAKVEAVLVSGSFLRALPRADEAGALWSQLTGKAPIGGDYTAFVAALLRLPVLDEAALAAYQDALRCVAALFAGGLPAEAAAAELRRLEEEVFARRLPKRAWDFVAAKRVRVLWGAQQQTRLQPWDQRELGLSRAPSLALALRLQDAPGAAAEEASAMLRGRAFQLECHRLARELGECVAGPLEAGGALVLSSLEPGKGQTASRLAVRDLIGRWVQALEQRFQARVLVGVGRVTPDPAQLAQSCSEAMAALQLGLHDVRPVQYYEQLPGEAAASSGGLQALACDLVEACGRGGQGELALRRDLYVREALRASAERPEVLRAHLLHALFGVQALLQRRGVLLPESLGELARGWVAAQDHAGTSFEMLAQFHAGLESAVGLLASPAGGERRLRLERAKRYALQDLGRMVPLAEAAREAGLSPSRFSRHFKACFGQGYAELLLQARLEEACRLLKGSALAAQLVGQECGFRSASHFVQAFRKRYGTTPQRYRRDRG